MFVTSHKVIFVSPGATFVNIYEDETALTHSVVVSDRTFKNTIKLVAGIYFQFNGCIENCSLHWI